MTTDEFDPLVDDDASDDVILKAKKSSDDDEFGDLDIPEDDLFADDPFLTGDLSLGADDDQY